MAHNLGKGSLLESSIDPLTFREFSMSMQNQRTNPCLLNQSNLVVICDTFRLIFLVFTTITIHGRALAVEYAPGTNPTHSGEGRVVAITSYDENGKTEGIGGSSLVRADTPFGNGRVLLTAAHVVEKPFVHVQGSSVDQLLVPGFAILRSGYESETNNNDFAMVILDHPVSAVSYDIARNLPTAAQHPENRAQVDVYGYGASPVNVTQSPKNGTVGFIGHSDRNNPPTLAMGLVGFESGKNLTLGPNSNPEYRHYITPGDSGGAVVNRGEIIGVSSYVLRRGEDQIAPEIASSTDPSQVAEPTFYASDAVLARDWITGRFLEGWTISDDRTTHVCDSGFCELRAYANKLYNNTEYIFHPAVFEPAFQNRERLIVGLQSEKESPEQVLYNGSTGVLELNSGLMQINGNATNRGRIVASLESSFEYSFQDNRGRELEFQVNGTLFNAPGGVLDIRDQSSKQRSSAVQVRMGHLANAGHVRVENASLTVGTISGTGSFSGSGAISGSLLHEGLLSPGGAGGTDGNIRIHGEVTSVNGARIRLDMYDLTNPENGWDMLTLDGGWENQANLLPLVFEVSTGGESPRSPVRNVNFDATQGYKLSIGTYDSHVAGATLVDARDFANARLGGEFDVSFEANEAFLTFTPVTGFANRKAWTGHAGQQFNNNENWVGLAPPLPSDLIVFDRNRSNESLSEILLSENHLARAASVRNDAIAIDVAGRHLSITESFHIAEMPGDNATALLTSSADGGQVSVIGGLFVGGNGLRTGYESKADLTIKNISVRSESTRIGGNGVGAMLVTDGGSLRSNSVTLGRIGGNADSLGALEISGENSRLDLIQTTNRALDLIGSRSGKPTTLRVSEQAVVENANQFRVGVGRDGYALAEVSNATLRNTDHGAWIGTTGYGELSVNKGGYLYSSANSSPTGTSGLLGQWTEGVGKVTIEGTGSIWEQNGSLAVGWRGEGHLNIVSGGTVVSAAGSIGRSQTATGTVVIDGSSSRWSIGSHLSVGGTDEESAGRGDIRIMDNGRVEATTIQIWETGSVLLGDGTIEVDNIKNNGAFVGTGTVLGSIENYGIVDVGTSLEPFGDFMVEGTYLQGSDGVTKIGIGGLEDFDQLSATVGIDLSGNLIVSFENEFAPKKGMGFQLFQSDGTLNLLEHRVAIENLAPGFEYTLMPNGYFLATSDGVYVPEPASRRLLIIACLLLMAYARRKPSFSL